jgi:hypothetical protein
LTKLPGFIDGRDFKVDRRHPYQVDKKQFVWFQLGMKENEVWKWTSTSNFFINILWQFSSTCINCLLAVLTFQCIQSTCIQKTWDARVARPSPYVAQAFKKTSSNEAWKILRGHCNLFVHMKVHWLLTNS